MSLTRWLSTLGIFRTLLVGVIALCGLLFTGTVYAVDCAQWLAVKEWRADMTISGQGQKNEISGDLRREWVFQSSASATYKLKVGDVNCFNGNIGMRADLAFNGTLPNVTWDARAQVNYSEQKIERREDGTIISTSTTTCNGPIPNDQIAGPSVANLFIVSNSYRFTPSGTPVRFKDSDGDDVFCYWIPLEYLVFGPRPFFPIPARDLILTKTINYKFLDDYKNWTISWTLYPAKLEPKCPCQTCGSIICIEPQSLAETVGLAGTSFSLHYQSERVPGRQGATWNAQKQALGGWTLNVHHAYDPASNALYLGDGTRRGIDALGAISLVGGKYRIPAEDGSEIYEFNTAGQHLRTLDALTNAVRYAFTYTQGRLTAITDRDGNLSRVERDAKGAPTAMVGPFGHRTTLTTSAGYLSAITDPAGARHALQYGAGGLLTTFTNPLGRSRHYTYDSAGQLLTATDPAGGTKRLTRTDTAHGHKVSLATPLGRTSTYTLEQLPGEQERRTVTGTDGLARGRCGRRTAIPPTRSQMVRAIARLPSRIPAGADPCACPSARPRSCPAG